MQLSIQLLIKLAVSMSHHNVWSASSSSLDILFEQVGIIPEIHSFKRSHPLLFGVSCWLRLILCLALSHLSFISCSIFDYSMRLLSLSLCLIWARHCSICVNRRLVLDFFVYPILSLITFLSPSFGFLLYFLLPTPLTSLDSLSPPIPSSFSSLSLVLSSLIVIS